MLSPHEFATLMLVKAAPDQIDLNRDELDTCWNSNWLHSNSSRLEIRVLATRRFSASGGCQ